MEVNQETRYAELFSDSSTAFNFHDDGLSADSTGQSIARRALQLQRVNPSFTALEVLDAALNGHRGTQPDFESSCSGFSSWLNPPSPFAELLREAFNPWLTHADLALLDKSHVTHDNQRRARTVLQSWHMVVYAFATRYQLWEEPVF